MSAPVPLYDALLIPPATGRQADDECPGYLGPELYRTLSLEDGRRRVVRDHSYVRIEVTP